MKPLTLNEALKAAGLPLVNEGVRETVMSDLSSSEREAIAATEKSLGKKLGEVSAKQFIEVLQNLYKGEIGGSAATYKELVADINRAYSGSARTSQF